QRDIAIQRGIARAVHVAEGAMPDLLLDRERAPSTYRLARRCPMKVCDIGDDAQRVDGRAVRRAIARHCVPGDGLPVGNQTSDLEPAFVVVVHGFGAISAARRTSARCAAFRAASADGRSSMTAISSYVQPISTRATIASRSIGRRRAS